MGYTTYFSGEVKLDPPLNEEQVAYIKAFSDSRRMDRVEGPYYVGDDRFANTGDPHSSNFENPNIRDHNRPDATQPGLWCQWIPTDDGKYLIWDDGEKFYCADDWMRYLIEHFLGADPLANFEDYDPDNLVPDFGTGRMCNGRIFAEGEDSTDHWILDVVDNIVHVFHGEISYPQMPDDNPVMGIAELSAPRACRALFSTTTISPSSRDHFIGFDLGYAAGKRDALVEFHSQIIASDSHTELLQRFVTLYKGEGWTS